MPCWGGHAAAQSSAYHCELDCTVKCDQYVLEMFFNQATDRIVELTKYHVPKDLQPTPKTAPNIITVLRKGSNRRTSYHCRDCNRDFVEEKDLHHHLSSARQHQDWYCCPCDAYFTTRDAYDLHMTKSPAHYLPLPPPPTPSHHASSKPWNRSQTPVRKSVDLWTRSQTPVRKSVDLWFLRERSHNQSSGSWGNANPPWARPDLPRDQSPTPTPEPEPTARASATSGWTKWRAARDPTPDAAAKARAPDAAAKARASDAAAADCGRGAAAVEDSAAEDWEDWGRSKKGSGSSWLPWGNGKAVGRGKWQGSYEQMVQPRA